MSTKEQKKIFHKITDSNIDIKNKEAYIHCKNLASKKLQSDTKYEPEEYLNVNIFSYEEITPIRNNNNDNNWSLL